MTELTQRHLGIPKALATKYAMPETDAHEELVAIGNLGLVKGAEAFREGAGKSLASWLFTFVEGYIRHAVPGHETTRDGKPKIRHATRWAKLQSLDAPFTEDGSCLADIAAVDNADPSLDVDRDDVLTYILRGLPPVDRALYRLRHGEGLSYREIGIRAGLSRQGVQYRLAQIEARVKRRLVFFGKSRRGRNLNPPHHLAHTEAQRLASSQHRKDCAKAARLLGDIPAGKQMRYLANDAERRLIGPEQHLYLLLAKVGVASRAKSGGRRDSAARDSLLASIGWRLLRGPEARPLAKDGYRLEEV